MNEAPSSAIDAWNLDALLAPCSQETRHVKVGPFMTAAGAVLSNTATWPKSLLRSCTVLSTCCPECQGIQDMLASYQGLVTHPHCL